MRHSRDVFRLGSSRCGPRPPRSLSAGRVRRLASATAVLVALSSFQALTVAPNTDPFAFFRPSVPLSVDDRRELDRGQPIARELPGRDHQIAVFAATRIDIADDRLVAWMRRIEDLKESAYVLAIGRFSDPPHIEDLADLVLDEEELSEIVACRPGSYGLKISAVEMTILQRAAAEAAEVLQLLRQRLESGERPLIETKGSASSRASSVADHGSSPGSARVLSLRPRACAAVESRRGSHRLRRSHPGCQEAVRTCLRTHPPAWG